MVIGVAVYIVDSQWAQALQGHRHSVIAIRKSNCLQLIVFNVGDGIQRRFEQERSAHHSARSIYFPNQLDGGVLREGLNLCEEATDSVKWKDKKKLSDKR